MVFYNEVLTPLNIRSAYIPENFYNAHRDIDRVNPIINSFPSGSSHVSNDLLVSQNFNKVKRMGNSVIYPVMLRKNKSNPEVLQDVKSSRGFVKQETLRKLNSDNVEDQSSQKGLYIMHLHETAKREDKNGVHLQKYKHRLSEWKTSKESKNSDLCTVNDTPPREMIQNKIKWLIPCAPSTALSQTERETNLMDFNYIPLSSKKAFPQTFQEILKNEDSACSVLSFIFMILEDSFRSSQPLFKHTPLPREIDARANHLLDFFFFDEKILERLVQNICFNFEVFCFLGRSDPTRIKNSSLFSMKILLLLLGSFGKIRSPEMKGQLKSLVTSNWHELQNSFYRVLKIEISTEAPISLNAFDIEKKFGQYSRLSIRFMELALKISDFDQRLFAELHESLLHLLFTRLLSARLSSIANASLSRLVSSIFQHCSEEMLMLLGFKLEFFARFKGAVLKVKQDVFEEQDLLVQRHMELKARPPKVHVLRNVLDVEVHFVDLIRVIVDRVESDYKRFMDTETFSMVFNVPKKPKSRRKNQLASSEMFQLKNLKINESQELGQLGPVYNTIFIRESQNFRILKDFCQMKVRFGIKMKVFVMDNLHNGAGTRKTTKTDRQREFHLGFQQQQINQLKQQILIGGLDNSSVLKRRPVFVGNLTENEKIANQASLRKKRQNPKSKKILRKAAKKNETGTIPKAVGPRGFIRRRKRDPNRAHLRRKNQKPFRQLPKNLLFKSSNKRSRSLRPELSPNPDHKLFKMLKKKRSQIFECAISNKRNLYV